jgi:hypothetical protein
MKLRILFTACLVSGSLHAQQPAAPKTMTKMEVILQSADAPAGSFAAQPKVFYRAGTQYCRIEEAMDAERGIHGVVIINEPDYWMVNLVDQTAKHAVDPGPTFNCHFPVFPNRSMKLPQDQQKQAMELEFGSEIAFFKKRGATPQPGPVLQTKQTTMYQTKVGDVTLALFTYGDPERPLGVVWTSGDDHDIFWYKGYGEVPFDPTLFAKPEHVKIETPKP